MKKRFLAFWGGFATIGIIAEALAFSILRNAINEFLNLGISAEVSALMIIVVTGAVLFATAVAAFIATVFTELIG